MQTKKDSRSYLYPFHIATWKCIKDSTPRCTRQQDGCSPYCQPRCQPRHPLRHPRLSHTALAAIFVCGTFRAVRLYLLIVTPIGDMLLYHTAIALVKNFFKIFKKRWPVLVFQSGIALSYDHPPGKEATLCTQGSCFIDFPAGRPRGFSPLRAESNLRNTKNRRSPPPPRSQIRFCRW